MMKDRLIGFFTGVLIASPFGACFLILAFMKP